MHALNFKSFGKTSLRNKHDNGDYEEEKIMMMMLMIIIIIIIIIIQK
jgi:hypothetical protein